MPDSLAELHDIHLPNPITWWPLASGYWLLLCGLLISFVVAVFLFSTRSRRRIRREALRKLAELESYHRQHLNANSTAAGISILLKQVALLYYPRASVAALQGEAWLLFLQQSSKKLPFESVRGPLLEAPFSAEYQANIDPLFHVAKAWIRQRSRRWLN